MVRRPQGKSKSKDMLDWAFHESWRQLWRRGLGIREAAVFAGIGAPLGIQRIADEFAPEGGTVYISARTLLLNRRAVQLWDLVGHGQSITEACSQLGVSRATAFRLQKLALKLGPEKRDEFPPGGWARAASLLLADPVALQSARDVKFLDDYWPTLRSGFYRFILNRFVWARRRQSH